METARTSDSLDLSKMIFSTITLLTENLIAVIVTVVICLGGGWLYSTLAVKVYESKMIIQSDILSESYSLKLADNLNSHIKSGDLEFLASKLGLTADEAYGLKELRLISALTPTSQQMQEKDKIIVVISVRVTDNTVLPKLQSGIIRYFSTNEYIKKRVDEKRKELESYIAALDRELKIMDTLKMKLSAGKFLTGKVGEVSVVEFASLFGVSADLAEKKFEAINDLAVVDSIQVVDELAPYGKPVWPKLSIVMLAATALAILIIFTLITVKAARRQQSHI